MKNRKKPFIYERVKRKLSKLFTYISANRFDILKRVACGFSVFAFACCMAIPFISNNKAYALSNPNTEEIAYIHSFNNMQLSSKNAINIPTISNTSLGNGLEPISYGDSNYSYYFFPYVNQYSKSNEFINTTFDGYATDNKNSDLHYYTQDGHAHIIQRKSANGTNNIVCYGSTGFNISNYVPSLYFGLKNTLKDLKVWYGVLPHYVTKDLLTRNFDKELQSKYFDSLGAYTENGFLIPTYTVLTLYMSYTGLDKETHSITFDSSISNNVFVDSSIPYYDYPSANLSFYNDDLDMIFSQLPTYNEVVKINSINISIVTYAKDIVFNDSTNRFEFVDYNTVVPATYYINTGSYMDYEPYLDNMINAQNLITSNSYTDGTLLKNFFSNFFDIEIVKGFPLYALTSFAFGIILIIVFVRLFR